MFIDRRLGGKPLYLLDRPKDWAMRVPDSIRKNVAFLGRIIQKGSEQALHFGGTGFFVAVPSGIPDRNYLYLVTARHTVEQLALGDWVIRINTKDGGCQDFRGNKDHKWWFHPTDADRTDVAVTQFGIPENLAIKALSEEMFLADEEPSERGVGAGDEVFIVGLFNKMRGRSRNIPIVRIGNVAMVPDPGELIPGVRIGRDRVVDADAYLIEARSIGGLSGSPVFIRETVEFQGLPVTQRDGSPKPQTCYISGPFYLLGVASGHWEIDPREKNDSDPRSASPATNPEVVNMGIAVVVPAKKIKETLYGPELVETRRQADQAYLDALGTTTPD